MREELLRILENMEDMGESGKYSGWSAGIIPLAWRLENGKYRLYVIGAIKDTGYPFAPFQFTFPLGYSEGELPEETATREFMEELVASVHANREMVFASIKDGKVVAFPLYVKDQKDTATGTLGNTVERLAGELGEMSVVLGEDRHMNIPVLGLVANRTHKNEKGREWRDVGYVALIGELDSIIAIDAEEFKGERLDRQIVAVPLDALSFSNYGKSLEDVGALAFDISTGRWTGFREYMEKEEWKRRKDRLYKADVDGMPFFPHPVLLRMWDSIGFDYVMEMFDIPGLTRPGTGYDDVMSVYDMLPLYRTLYSMRPEETGQGVALNTRNAATLS